MKLAVKNLVVNPGQMRTELSIDGMVQLVQMAQDGQWPDRPIRVTPDEDGTYRVVTGHRLWMALMLAEIYEGMDKPRPSLERWITGLTMPKEGDEETPPGELLLHLYPELVEQVPDLEVLVDVREFEDTQAEQLALIEDNMGAEEPDLIGLANAVKRARDEGASYAKLISSTGMNRKKIDALLRLPDAGPVVQQMVRDGQFSLSLISALADLDAQQAEAIVHCAAMQGWTLKRVQEAVDTVDTFGIPQPKLEDLPERINDSRIQTALWDALFEKDPVQAWELVAMHNHSLFYYIRLALRELGIDVESDEDLVALVPEIACETCQIKELIIAAPTLKGLYPEYPCGRAGTVACKRAVGPEDTFWISGSYRHERLPHIVRRGHEYGWDSAELFVQDMEVLREQEKQRRTETTDAGRPSDVKGQRRLIRRFLEHHLECEGVRHPLATRCDECVHRLQTSPTKNPRVPHCQWAARRRNVSFHALYLSDDVTRTKAVIPICDQFMPKEQDWSELVPKYPHPVTLSRSHMIQLIEHHDEGRKYSSHTLPQLTGCPMRAADRWGNWFAEQFDDQVGNLSDEQLMTLLLWVLAQWQLREKKVATVLLGNWIPVEVTRDDFALWFQAVNMEEEPEEEDDEDEEELEEDDTDDTDLHEMSEDTDDPEVELEEEEGGTP